MARTSEKLLQLQSSIVLLHGVEDNIGNVIGSIVGAFISVYYTEDSTPFDKAASRGLIDSFMEQMNKELDGERMYVYMLDEIVTAILAIKELEDKNENDG